MRALAHTEGTLTRRALAGDEWTRVEHLLMLILDELRVANWQRTRDGQRGRNRPRPVSPLARRQGSRLGGTSRDPEQVKAYLARFGPPPR